ncbi:MAG: hypothetical protein DRP10_02160 [Candidatus Aenigmatarchaeota archaeon]|nr:MAG: hypothetical protein DRP10_02160 [Candidatus Aenigmarchaeota archaeon]
MEERTFAYILKISERIARASKVKKLRPLSKEIAENVLKREGVIIIPGVRGSGKTTLLSELYSKEKNAIFINAEVLAKQGVSLLDYLHYSYAKGFRVFLIDEIHILPEWEKDVKIFYDETKSKIVISGSSAIALRVKGSELSRRATFYELKPLSFREYLYFRVGRNFPKRRLEYLLDLKKRRKLEKMVVPYLDYFLPYLQFDALPAAFFERKEDVYINIVERTLRYDLAYIRPIDNFYIDVSYKILKFISLSPPSKVSYSRISSQFGVSINFVRDLLYSLEQTGIIYRVAPYGKGKVRKEEKVLMPLSFRSALCLHYNENPDKGGLREDFFVQHVGKCFYFKTGIERRTPDFVVDDCVFEIGGPSKGFEQIKKYKKAFLVKEAILLEKEKEVPIYLFGFLY